MTIEIYLDAINGSDTLGNGSSLTPYKTLQYFCDSVAVKNNADYKVFLNNGVYEITNGTIFGQFNSGNMTIIGKGENTEIIQRAYMYQNSVGGNLNFTLTIAKCKYNILTTLTGANVNGFRWTWNFYNVLFEYTPNNQTSVFSVNSKELVFRNCVKLTNTTSFLRKNSSIISVYDSMGYFTSGYQTTQADWDKGGNKIGSLDNYMELLDYQGEYPWITSKSLILHDGEYKKWNKEVVPINVALSKTYSSSGNYNTNTTADKAFDGDKTTRWLADGTGGSGNKWVSVDLGTAMNIKKITLIQDSAFRCKAFRIEYSDNNSTWNTAISGEMLQDINPQDYYFDIGSYRYWRLFIVESGTTGQAGIAEFELYTIPETIPSKWSTVSSTLPTSTQFLEQGMDSLSPLLNREVTTLEPMSMTDKSEILGVNETGKVFSETINLKKYFDIRSIRTEGK